MCLLEGLGQRKWGREEVGNWERWGTGTHRGMESTALPRRGAPQGLRTEETTGDDSAEAAPWNGQGGEVSSDGSRERRLHHYKRTLPQ